MKKVTHRQMVNLIVNLSSQWIRDRCPKKYLKSSGKTWLDIAARMRIKMLLRTADRDELELLKRAYKKLGMHPFSRRPRKILNPPNK